VGHAGKAEMVIDQRSVIDGQQLMAEILLIGAVAEILLIGG